MVGTPFLLPASAHPSAVTRANFDKIQHGMTGDEVEAILGPQGNYSRHRCRFVALSGMYQWCWVSDEGAIFVEMGTSDPGLDDAGRVENKIFFPEPKISYGELWLHRLDLL
jgi:hypothetical protein